MLGVKTCRAVRTSYVLEERVGLHRLSVTVRAQLASLAVWHVGVGPLGKTLYAHCACPLERTLKCLV